MLILLFVSFRQSVEALFKAHADATDTLQLYRDVMGGAPSASSTERAIVHGRVVSQQQSKPAAPVHNVAPLLDLSDDVSNPLLMAQTITPVTRTQPVAASMARTATPSRERPQAAAPSAAVPTPDLLGDPFAPVAKPVPAATPTSSTTTHDPFATSADPFGGGSSIDSLLAQPPASNKPAQTDVMALFNTPPSTSPNAMRK